MLDRRLAALRWDREVLGYAAAPEQLAAMRLHALIVNPALTGLDYVEWVATALPGLALLVCGGRAPVAERVRGLRAGADDWITKPCHPDELIARLEAVLRRRRTGEMPLQDDVITAGELAIRPDRFDACVGDATAGLSRKEYELLHQLAVADGRVLEREDIYQRVWGYTMVRGDRSVDVFVRKLRQKLERVSPDWRYVHTHFGVGYRFAAEPADGAASGVAAPAMGGVVAPGPRREAAAARGGDAAVAPAVGREAAVAPASGSDASVGPGAGRDEAVALGAEEVGAPARAGGGAALPAHRAALAAS